MMEAMLALDAERAQAVADPLQEVAAAQPEEAVTAAAEAELSSEGAIPAVADPAATTEVGATASEQAFGDKPTAPSGQVDGGMHEPEAYHAACVAAGTPDKWHEEYARGHTSARQWVQPYEGRYDMVFELKRGESASQAVKDFLAGPTIADYRTIAVAMAMDELRDEFGDQRFDRSFGSSDAGQDAGVSATERLRISSAMYTIPFADQMRALAAESESPAQTEEPEEPAAAARVAEIPHETATPQPAPEMIADELGIQHELA
jgi:hypothetical protein